MLDQPYLYNCILLCDSFRLPQTIKGREHCLHDVLLQQHSSVASLSTPARIHESAPHTKDLKLKQHNNHKYTYTQTHNNGKSNSSPTSNPSLHNLNMVRPPLCQKTNLLLHFTSIHWGIWIRFSCRGIIAH